MFIPTVCRVPYRFLIQCKLRNIRNLKLRDFFKDSLRDFDSNSFENKFLTHSTWIPPISSLSEETVRAINTISTKSNLIIQKRLIRSNGPSGPFIKCRDNSHHNLSSQELGALQELKTNKSIIIKPADKGGAVVIMDKELYKNEGLRQLLNPHYYEEIQRPLANETVPKINNILLTLLKSGFISTKQFNFLQATHPKQQRPFYLLPKIHKPRSKWPNWNMPEGRPIVSDCGSETYHICDFIDFFLKPIATKQFSYLKDTYDFVSKVRNLVIPKDAFLVTGDVSALYTNMNIDRSLTVVRDAFCRSPDTNRPDDCILQLLEICLKYNDFYFAGRTFLQKCGTAMGKSFAPNLANLYLTFFDESAVNNFRIKPLHFYRYIDDIFFIWPGSYQELLVYNDFLNTIIPGIKVSLSIKKEITEFLDTRIYKCHSPNNTVLCTSVFFKPTDTHQLLHGKSFHPRHTTRGILKSQLIRFKRLSSSKYEYDHACHTLFNVLRLRGYSRSTYRRLKLEIWSSTTYDLTGTPSSTSNNRPIFPILNYYDPIGSKLTKIFRNSIKNLPIYHSLTILQSNLVHRNLGKLLTKSRFEG